MMFEHPNLFILILPVLFVGIKMLLAKKRRFLVVMRMLVLFLLICALANPYTLKLTKTQDEAPGVVVVDDTTNSMNLFKTADSEADAIVTMLKDKTPTSKRIIPEGEKTALGDAIITYSSQADHIILVSDLNSNHGRQMDDALEFVSRTGATVYAIKQEPEKNDLSIELAGSKNIIIGNENKFRAIIRQAKEQGQTGYDVEVSVDGKTIFREGVTQTDRMNILSLPPYTFEELGIHEMKAVLIPSGEDTNAENNVFYKSIYVVPKPKILLISPDKSLSSPLLDVLTSLYDVTTTSAISDIAGYKSIVLDDLPLSYLDEDEIAGIKGFVSEGGGLVAVGGPRSYERGGYLDSALESVLPVESVASKYLGNDTNIVVIIDVSGSTAASWANLEESKRSDVSNFIAGIRTSIYGEDTQAEVSVLDLQKAQAISIIRNFKSRDNVGVIAFSGSSHIVPDDNATTLFRGSDTAILEDPIMRLQSTMGTVLYPAQEKAWEMLNQTAPGGNNYVVIISDGQFRGGKGIDQGVAFTYSKNLAKQMAEDGIRTYTVFMGFTKYIETDAAYNQMKTLSDLGGGNVLVPDAYERLKVTFDDKPPEENREEKPEETNLTYPLEIFDATHFITRGIAIEGGVTGFNDVTDKAGAKRLVTTDKGKPIVTVWNFGLGHVAAVTTDDGRAWGGVLYAGDNARLMPTTINWAIRNPMPDTDGTITADDVWLGDDGAVSVQSSSVPTVTYQGTDVNLVRVVADIYRGSITPKKTGFSTIGGYGVATNYPLEYRDVGFNADVAAAVTQSGGYVYTPQEARKKLFEDVKKSAERTSVEPVDQSMMFILAALILYFIEIAIRRIGEIMRMKRINRKQNA